ncbi:hypothetical protein SAMN03159443_04306 [Pseudomonas sp. NFACC15-1]|nr:hypothetical protein SAMN03159443_04306 [Pseudomonas sp. NFACC15-1]SDW11053.1 hypothetical protein SAMN03159380_00051 [Pseudomonas sp. NFACC14]
MASPGAVKRIVRSSVRSWRGFLLGRSFVGAAALCRSWRSLRSFDFSLGDSSVRGKIAASLRSTAPTPRASGSRRPPHGALNEKCPVPFDTEHFFKASRGLPGIHATVSLLVQSPAESRAILQFLSGNPPGVLQAFWFQGRSPCSSLMRVGRPITSSASRNASAGSSSTLTMRCTSHSPRATSKAAATGGTPAV